MAEWLKDRWRRLRSQWRHTLGFAAVGALIGELREVPKWMERATNQDAEWLLFTVARRSERVHRGPDHGRRLAPRNGQWQRPGQSSAPLPAAFALLSSTIATTLSWSVYALLALGRAAMLR
ncbi:hypothetical protein LP419_13865 [Massilia sp. H-1]|nr:hypothetical protein LP419_13865 [Massilia sp. H-1]